MRSRSAIGLMLLLCACGSNMGGLPGTGGGGGNGGSGGSAGSGGGGSGGNGGGTGGNGGADLSFGGGGRDASVAYGCNEILSCITTCGGPTNKQCVGMCRAGATQMGRGLYQQLSSCLRQACYVHADAAADPCVNGGMATPQCRQCLADAESSTGPCSSEYTACASN